MERARAIVLTTWKFLGHAAIVHWLWGLGAGVLAYATMSFLSSWPWTTIAPFALSVLLLTLAAAGTWGTRSSVSGRKSAASDAPNVSNMHYSDQPSLSKSPTSAASPRSSTTAEDLHGISAIARGTPALRDQMKQLCDDIWSFYGEAQRDRPGPDITGLDAMKAMTRRHTADTRWASLWTTAFKQKFALDIEHVFREYAEAKVGPEVDFPDPYSVKSVDEIARLADSIKEAIGSDIGPS